jgi:hypothetical protein
MKVTVTEKQSEPEGIKFPVLMEYIDGGLPIVLFTDARTGIVMVEDSDHYFAEKVYGWIPCTNKTKWTPFTGTITLQND